MIVSGNKNGLYDLLVRKKIVWQTPKKMQHNYNKKKSLTIHGEKCVQNQETKVFWNGTCVHVAWNKSLLKEVAIGMVVSGNRNDCYALLVRKKIVRQTPKKK